MRCFNHAGNEAIGICRNCCKGLCSNCLVQVNSRLACLNSCEEAVAILNKLNERSHSFQNIAGKNYKAGAFFMILFGLVFIAAALITFSPNEPYFFITLAFGSIFIGAGLRNIKLAKNFSANR